MLKGLFQFTIAGLLTLPGLAAAAGAVQLPATNQTACFAENGNTRPCAGTGEDGEKLAGVAWPAPRFADNLNGTVSDKLTGLIWSKHANAPELALGVGFCPGTPGPQNDMTWLQSLDFITCLNTSSYKGFSDWRLPNLNELESMVNAGATDTSVYLNANGFGLGTPSTPNTQVQASQYWTSTSDASDMTSAWDVDLLKGEFPFSTLKNDPLLTNAVWPVRGASTLPAQLWRTGQTLCFDEVGAARPCAATGEDGEKLAGAAWPVPRFTPNAGATLALDKVTGLFWATSTLSPGPAAACADTGLNLSWQQALTHVACLNTNTYLGRSDWRLPNRKELRSLADYSMGAPALPAGHPFNDQAGLTYWSSTTDAAIPRNAWVISMFDGSLSSAVKAGTLPAWPVSGPDLVAPVLTLNPVTAITNKKNQTITGTMEAGATVVVKLGAAILPVTVNGTSWNATVSGLVAGANNITVTATGAPGNVATQAATITFTAPDGLISGGSAINIGDALKALRIAVGIIPPSFDDLLRGDVAPMGAPDDKIDAGDALLILKKSVGLPSF